MRIPVRPLGQLRWRKHSALWEIVGKVRLLESTHRSTRCVHEFGSIFVGLFVRRQFRLDEPLLRLEVLKSRRYRTASLTIFFLQATLIGLNVLMPL